VGEVADDRDLEPGELALVAAHRGGVEQGLGRVLVLAVAGVDHRAPQGRARTCGAPPMAWRTTTTSGRHRVEVLGGVEERLALGRSSSTRARC
jgi:hypothetical protein